MDNSSCSIVFTGDIGFDRYMAEKWTDESLLSPAIQQFITSADHVAPDVEGALIRADDDGSRGVFFHSMDPAAASLLQKIQADIWCIGNNHITDAGREGVQSTLELAASCSAQTVGAGLTLEEASRPVILPEAGGIGLLGVAYMNECIPATDSTPGILPWTDLQTIAARIRDIKKVCRWCVIVSHGGEEFTALPSPYTRDRYRTYLDLGADVVVGTHPHVPENFEWCPGGKLIVYSLGNFIFDTDYQRAHLYTDAGVLLKLRFTGEAVAMEAMGTRIDRTDERVVEAPLPDIFTDVSSEEYGLLAPLAAKAFIREEKRKMLYLEPDRFTAASDLVWSDYFFSTEPDGYDKGNHMDFSLICPLADKAADETWKQSRLDKVIRYLQALL